ncbi:MAG: tripartite tricarboxylate transporter substrate binding protein [Alphaproteobacteria bacterium]|nr:tripartite tricarboxylate transporter substrate binding protein [Alphaproteobacteria bacterium]
MRLPVLLTLAVLGLAGSAGAHAEGNYPDHAVRVVVPFAPGGSLDMLARALGRSLSDRLGQQFVVDNRSGAGGNLGHDAVAKAKPDGYTLLVTSEPLTINPALFGTLPYDPARDLAPIMLAASLAQVVIVHPGSTVRTLADWLEAARTRAQPMQFASAGLGSPGHLAGELLKAMVGANLVHVPYRGGGPAVADVAAAQIECGIMTLPAALGFIQAGTVRALAVTARTRAGALPQTPTIGEVVPGYFVDSWQAVFAPAGTPPDVIARLNRELAAVLAEPSVRELLEKQGFDIVAGSPDALGTLVTAELAKWGRFIKEAGIKVE